MPRDIACFVMVDALVFILAALFIKFGPISIHIHKLLLRCIVLLVDLVRHNLKRWVLIQCVCAWGLSATHRYRRVLRLWWSISISVLASNITNIEDIHAIIVLDKLSVLVGHVIVRHSSVLIAL